MKRIVVFVLSCFVLSMMAISPAQSYTNPAYSDADAVATALAAYNTADSAYNSALNAYNSANAAYNAARTNFENAKATYDAAVVEYNAAALALNAAILASNAATNYMNNQCRQLGCSDSAYAAAVADWQSKYGAYLAALARRDVSIVSANTSRDAYNASISVFNATVVPNNIAASNLATATAAKTAAYNLYVEAKATADRNNTTKFIPPKIPLPKTVTTTDGPKIVITREGQQKPAQRYENCIELRNVFSKGVAKDKKSVRKTGATVNAKVYTLNKGYDRDKDGVACELT